MNESDRNTVTLIAFIAALFFITRIEQFTHFTTTRDLITTHCGATP